MLVHGSRSRCLQNYRRPGRPLYVRHVYGHHPDAVRKIQRKTGPFQGHAPLRNSVYRMLSAGLFGETAPSGSGRLCVVRSGGRYYVAGLGQRLRAELSPGRDCHVCLFGPGRRSGRGGQPHPGGKYFRTGRRRPEGGATHRDGLSCDFGDRADPSAQYEKDRPLALKRKTPSQNRSKLSTAPTHRARGSFFCAQGEIFQNPGVGRLMFTYHITPCF